MRTKKTILVRLDATGIDSISEAIGQWLSEAGEQRRNILRTRIAMEALLGKAAEHSAQAPEVMVSFHRGLGRATLTARYGGERFDPTNAAENDLDEWSDGILVSTGYYPTWRWRGKQNELSLSLPGAGIRTELVLLGCIAAAVALGLMGGTVPEGIRAVVGGYVLTLLSDAFLNLLNTFIGVMIFLSVINGICGIGNAAAFGKIGKTMVFGYLSNTFLICGVNVLACALFFHPAGGVQGNGASQFHALLEMIAGIIPGDPISPFQTRNTLQIVLVAAVVGGVLLCMNSDTTELRRWLLQTQALIMRIISAICVLLPLYIFTSLLQQFWDSGIGIFVQLWKPLVLCVLISAVLLAVTLLFTCFRVKVSPFVLVPKLMPDFLVGLSTASAATAMPLSLEINEKKLGIDPVLSNTGTPIGAMLLVGSYTLLYVITGAYLAEWYGVSVNLAWWVTLWLVCAILSMASPPVAGGTLSCLSILMTQLGIPAEGLTVGLTLTMFLDFICTGVRIPLMHLEQLSQAQRLGMLNREILCRKQ